MKKFDNIINLTIAGIPQAKIRSRKGSQGHWYNPQSDLMYRISREIKNQLPDHWIPIQKGIPVSCSILAFFPFQKNIKNKDQVPCLNKKDIDNIAKFILDCMNKIVFHDDKQVYSLTIEKYYDTLERMEIEILW